MGPLREARAQATAPLGRAESADLYALQRRLRDAMWEHAGLVRDAAGLHTALAVVEEVERELEAVGVPGGPGLNRAWQDWLDLGNQATAARLIILSALERRESRGAHWRRDFPETGAEGLYSVRVRREDASARVRRVPVALTRVRPPEAAVAPAAVEIGD
jgi:fumarate reductase flavoprotein subunit